MFINVWFKYLEEQLSPESKISAFGVDKLNTA